MLKDNIFIMCNLYLLFNDSSNWWTAVMDNDKFSVELDCEHSYKLIWNYFC
jgi:hypothetical protein